MLSYFLIGAALGVATGVPIGAVGVAVIDASYRHPMRRAVAVGIGGSVGDLICAALGILGLGPLLLRHPGVPPILYALSGVALVVYGSIQIRSRPASFARDEMTKNAEHQGSGHGQARTGFALGLGPFGVSIF